MIKLRYLHKVTNTILTSISNYAYIMQRRPRQLPLFDHGIYPCTYYDNNIFIIIVMIIVVIYVRYIYIYIYICFTILYYDDIYHATMYVVMYTCFIMLVYMY